MKINTNKITFNNEQYEVSVAFAKSKVEVIVWDGDNNIERDHWVIYNVVKQFETLNNNFLEEQL